MCLHQPAIRFEHNCGSAAFVQRALLLIHVSTIVLRAQGLCCCEYSCVAVRASAAVASGPQQPGCQSHSGGEHWHEPCLCLSRFVACDGHPTSDFIDSWRACQQPQFMAAWNTQPISGRREEPVSCPSADTGVFQALKDAGIGLIVSGHDHDNNFCAKHDGVQLCYGHKTGYGSYGPPPGWQRGARILQYTFGNRGEASLQTWIRLEDGTVLNDTLTAAPPDPQTVCNAGARPAQHGAADPARLTPCVC